MWRALIRLARRLPGWWRFAGCARVDISRGPLSVSRTIYLASDQAEALAGRLQSAVWLHAQGKVARVDFHDAAGGLRQTVYLPADLLQRVGLESDDPPAVSR